MRDPLELISEIEKNEFAAASRFDLASFGSITNADSRREAFEVLFTLNAQGGRDTIQYYGGWVPEIPVLWQLTIQPCLIVDIVPKPEDKFLEDYGVSPLQMARLAREGFVVPNLYTYESDKKQEFRAHLTHSEVLRPILDQTTTRCRIHAIRNNQFLDQFVGKDAFSDYVKDGEALFAPPLSKLSAEHIQVYTRSTNLTGAIQKVSKNWAYVLAFGADNDSVKTWIDETRKNLSENPNDSEYAVRVVGTELPARKCWLASPYTAVFGGVHNLGKLEADAVFEPGSLIDISKKGKNRRTPSKEQIEGMRYLYSLGLGQQVLDTCEPDEDLLIPHAPEDDEFSNFLSFLKDKRELLRQASEWLEDVRTEASNRGHLVKRSQDYLRAIEEFRAAKRRLLKVSKSVAVGGVAADAGFNIAQQLIHIPVSTGVSIVGLGLGLALLSLLTPRGQQLVEGMLAEAPRRILAYHDKLLEPPRVG